jgi:hypothetical protein
MFIKITKNIQNEKYMTAYITMLSTRDTGT